MHPACWITSVVSNSFQPYGSKPTRLLCPWDFPGKVLEWGAIAFSASSLLAYYKHLIRASWLVQLVKNLPAMQEILVWFLGQEDPLEKVRLPTPVFWPGGFHGLYSPWGRKESDMTEWLSVSSLTMRHILNEEFWKNANSMICHARYWMLGAGALGRPRGMVWGERREEGSGWGTHVYLWRFLFDIWQN